MTDKALAERNLQMWHQCNPVFAGWISGILADLQGQGFRARCQQAWRSPDEQLDAYNRGASKLKWGLHCCCAPDGGPDSLAMDLVEDDHPLEGRVPFLLAVGWAARRHQSITGILWGVPVYLQSKIVTAMEDARFDAPIAAHECGWDPLHIQPAGVGIVWRARRLGWRPS